MAPVELYNIIGKSEKLWLILIFFSCLVTVVEAECLVCNCQVGSKEKQKNLKEMMSKTMPTGFKCITTQR